MPRLLLAFALVASTALAAGVQAQPLPGALAWERVGPTAHVQYDSTAVTDGLTFVADTLVVSTDRAEMLYLDPATGRWADWRVSYGTPAGASGLLRALPLTASEAALEPGAGAGTPVVFFDPGGLFRAGPQDTRWQGVLGGSVDPLPVRGPGGALYSGTNRYGNGDSSIVRSQDGGRLWEALTGYTGVYPYALAHAAAVPDPPMGGLPEGGALVSADAFGLAWAHGTVSEGAGGGALAWQSVSDFPFRFRSVVAVEAGPRAGGKAGRFLAAGYDGAANRSRVLASDDGGQTWSPVFEAPLPGGFFFVTGAPDGAAYAFYEAANISRTLYGSADGGQTWADLGLVGPAPEQKFGIDQLIVGPDGRLYTGGHDGTPGYNPLPDEVVGGVWRTAEPVVSVASETDEPSTPDAFGVGAFPNPSRGTLTVSLTGPVTGGRVRLTIYDVLGREVARQQAEYAAGRHEARLDVGALAPGLYVVRARTDDGATATTRFTVSR